MVKNMIAYGGGVLAFVVVLLLLRLVCKELFRIGGRQKSEERPLNGTNKSEKNLPVILPAALSCVMLAIYAVISSYSSGGKLGSQGTVSDLWAWMLCVISSLFYVGGSVLIDLITRESMYPHLKKNEKWRAYEAGIRASVFFCIAPFAVLMVLPYRYSVVMFFLLASFYAYQKEKFGLAILGLAGAMIADELCVLPVLGFAFALFYVKTGTEKRRKGFLLAGCGLLIFILRETAFHFLFNIMPFDFIERFRQPAFFAEMILFCFPLYVYGARRIRNEKYFTVLWTGEGILCGFLLMSQAAFAV